MDNLITISVSIESGDYTVEKGVLEELLTKLQNEGLEATLERQEQEPVPGETHRGAEVLAYLALVPPTLTAAAKLIDAIGRLLKGRPQSTLKIKKGDKSWELKGNDALLKTKIGEILSDGTNN